ncbi:8803_t:CDS:2, partial [Gigaspora margarita]
KFQMETELNPIPKKDYKTIEANSFSLNIPNTFDIIYVYKLITYWYGYYMKEASDLFKQAADKNVPSAQLRYAFSLLNENKRKEFIEYLTQVADNEKGKKYLKLAAKKGYEDAIKL